MDLSLSSADTSLSQHVEALYPFAQVLVGSEHADTLVKRVYERAASVSEDDRPDEIRPWLFGLMLTLRNEEFDGTGEGDENNSETSFTSDPFRTDVAAQTAKRSLPVAFAACSVKERFILALDALGQLSDERLADVLDTTPSEARAVRDRARSALRASLRDVLKGPERMLVDVALPEEDLHSHLRSYLQNQVHSPPASLGTTVRRIINETQTDDPERPSNRLYALLNGTPALPSWITTRVLVGMVCGLLIVAAGIGTAVYLDSPASPPSAESMVEVAVDHMSEITVGHETSDPTEAARYVRQTWNRRVSVPSVDSASLTGVGHIPIGRDSDLPFFLYEDDESDGQIAIFAYSYALIDTVDGRVTLARSLRSKLASNQALLEANGESEAVVLWRQQDDILVAVAPHLNAESLRRRIRL